MTNTTFISVYLPPDLENWIEDEAKTKGLTKTDIILLALERYYEIKSTSFKTRSCL